MRTGTSALRVKMDDRLSIEQQRRVQRQIKLLDAVIDARPDSDGKESRLRVTFNAAADDQIVQKIMLVAGVVSVTPALTVVK